MERKKFSIYLGISISPIGCTDAEVNGDFRLFLLVRRIARNPTYDGYPILRP